MMKTRTRVLNGVMVALLALCVLVPMAFTNTAERLFSDADNRYCAEWPGSDEEQLYFEDYTSGIDDYLSDRIGFRKEAMSGYIWGNDKAFHVMTHPDYDYGTNDYLFHAFDFYVAPDEYVELYSDYVVMLNEYCKQRGITFLYVNTPSKEFVYDEYMPDYVPMKRNVFNVMRPIFEENNVEYLDLTDALRQAKDEGNQVFHTFYDPGHWNTAGAFAGSNALLAKLAEMGVDVEQANMADYVNEKRHVEYQTASVYPLDIEVDRYVHKKDGTESKQLPDFERDLELSSWAPVKSAWENSSVDNDVNLLMFQGSYFNSQGEVVQHQVSRATLVHDYVNAIDAVYYVNVVHPDVLIFECADYTVRSGYYGEYDLLVADLPPVFESTYDPAWFDQVEAPLDQVTFEPSAAIANFTVPCDTSEVKYAYVQVNGTIYECLIRDEDIHWGIDAKVLGASQSAQAFIVGSDGSLLTYTFEIARK